MTTGDESGSPRWRAWQSETCRKRLAGMYRELERLHSERSDKRLWNDPVGSCRVELVDGNLSFWRLTLVGPRDSPYAGGVFRLIMSFTADYPDLPLLKFETRIYHPSVLPDGTLVVDRRQLSEQNWTLGAEGMVALILSVLLNPSPDEACVPEIGHLLATNRSLFNLCAQAWTRRYAMPDPDQELWEEDLVGQMSNMRRQIDELLREKCILQQQVEALIGERDALRKDKDSLDSEMGAAMQDLNALRLHMDTLLPGKNMGTAVDTVGKMQGHIMSEVPENGELQNEVHALQRSLGHLQINVSDLQQHAGAIQQDKDLLDSEMNAATNDISNLHLQVEALLHGKDEIQDRYHAAMDTVGSVQGQMMTEIAAKGELQNQVDALQKSLSALQCNVDCLQDDRAELLSEKHAMLKQAEMLIDERDAIQKDKEMLYVDMSIATKDISSLRQNVDSLLCGGEELSGKSSVAMETVQGNSMTGVEEKGGLQNQIYSLQQSLAELQHNQHVLQRDKEDLQSALMTARNDADKAETQLMGAIQEMQGHIANTLMVAGVSLTAGDDANVAVSQVVDAIQDMQGSNSNIMGYAKGQQNQSTPVHQDADEPQYCHNTPLQDRDELQKHQTITHVEAGRFESPLLGAVREMQGRMMSTLAEKEALRDQVSSLQQIKEEMQSHLDALWRDTAELQSAMTAAQCDTNRVESQLSNAISENERLQEQANAMNRQMHDLLEDLTLTVSEKGKITDKLREQRFMSTVEVEVMKLKLEEQRIKLSGPVQNN